jgi:hypothetical protein
MADQVRISKTLSYWLRRRTGAVPPRFLRRR